MPQQWQWNVTTVTTVIAVLSLILNFVQMWQRRSERKGKCRVTLETGIELPDQPLFSSVPSGEFYGDSMRVVVENHGVPSVSFSESCGVIEVEGARVLVGLLKPIDVIFPCTLEHGQRMSFAAEEDLVKYVLHEKYGPGMRKLRADVEDQLSRHYKSKWVRFDVT